MDTKYLTNNKSTIDYIIEKMNPKESLELTVKNNHNYAYILTKEGKYIIGLSCYNKAYPHASLLYKSFNITSQFDLDALLNEMEYIN